MKRYIAKAGRMLVTVPDGVELPTCSFEPVVEPEKAPSVAVPEKAPRAAAPKRKSAASSRAKKER